jgi:PIN domain nuclease of toxin-antitoxin system
LPLHHRDPFDRQIIAQTLAEAMPVVTVDPFFRLYEGVEVIW